MIYIMVWGVSEQLFPEALQRESSSNLGLIYRWTADPDWPLGGGGTVQGGSQVYGSASLGLYLILHTSPVTSPLCLSPTTLQTVPLPPPSRDRVKLTKQ